MKGYVGPHLVPTLTEVALIRDALHGRTDTAARQLAAKCDIALNTDNALRRPT